MALKKSQTSFEIGILYICTGNYSIFWKDFFLSSEKHFLPGHQKQYFVFTDGENLWEENNSRVHKYYQKQLGWPYDTLMRFEIFLRAKADLVQCDYLFFLNANMKFLQTVGEEIFPYEDQEDLIAVQHPGFWDKPVHEFTYDRNILSKAFVSKGEGENYFMGGFNGGTASAYLEMIYKLKKNTQDDLDNNVIALWHDESHLNNYLLNRNIKILSPAYGYPEDWDLPFKPKVLILDKNKLGGHTFFRELDTSPILKPHNSLFKRIRLFFRQWL